MVKGSCINKALDFLHFFQCSNQNMKAQKKEALCFIYLAKEVRRCSGGGPVSVQVTVQGGVAGGEGLARLAGLAPGLAAGGEGGAPRGGH